MVEILGVQWMQPWALLGLLVPILLGLLRIFQNKRKITIAIGYVPTGLKPERSWRTVVDKGTPWLKIVAIALLVLAIARPVRVYRIVGGQKAGIDVMLVMDVSKSMKAQDIAPNRLDASKMMAKSFVEKRVNDRIGLVQFAGEALTLSPLTLEHWGLKRAIERMESTGLQDGTAIGLGMSTGIGRLREDSSRKKVMILLSDGANNAGQVDPSMAIALANRYKIKVYTIGLGTKGEASANSAQQKGKELDEEMLQQIALSTGGTYYGGESATELEEIYAEINKLEKKLDQEPPKVQIVDLYDELVKMAMVFLLLTFVFRYVVLHSLF